MTATEGLVVLGVVMAGVWIAGVVADALIGRTPLTRALRFAQDRTRHAVAYARGRTVAIRLALLRIDHTRAPRTEPARPAYRQEP